MELTDLDTKKLAATEAAQPMPVAADTNSTVDDSCSVIVVEDTDESTACKRRKLDDSEVDDVWVTIHKVILTRQCY